jgi:sodium/bile acid cotransporter 7
MSTAMADTSSLESTRKAEPRSFWTLLKQTFDFVLSQWLLLAIGLVILLAHFFPQVGKRGGYIRSEYTINYGAVAIIFLASGLTLPFDQLVKHAKNIRLHLIVQVTSFLITSAVFFGIAAAASTSRALETSTLVGLVATGCLPTTISSNVVMTRQAGGDVAATMVEVTLGNILGPFISPLLLVKLYLPAISAFKAAWIPAEATDNLTGMYGQVMKQMGLSVYVPLFIGQVIRGIWPKQVSTFAAKCRLAKIGSLCLISLIW